MVPTNTEYLAVADNNCPSVVDNEEVNKIWLRLDGISLQKKKTDKISFSQKSSNPMLQLI